MKKEKFYAWIAIVIGLSVVSIGMWGLMFHEKTGPLIMSGFNLCIGTYCWMMGAKLLALTQ